MARITLVALVLALALMPGCTKKEAVEGSCSAGPIDDGSIICIDYRDGKQIDEWRAVCTTVMRGTWSEGACDTTNALGGCTAGKNVVWLYPSETHALIEEARESCASKGREFIPVTGI